MKICQTCKLWQRHYPNDGGVCWSKEQPNLQGIHATTQDSVGRVAIGDTMAELFSGESMTVTRYDASCDNHS